MTARIRFIIKKVPIIIIMRLYTIAKAGWSTSIKLYMKELQSSVETTWFTKSKEEKMSLKVIMP
jgi:hypothetical protein